MLVDALEQVLGLTFLFELSCEGLGGFFDARDRFSATSSRG